MINFSKRPIYLRPAAYVFALGIVLPASASFSAELTGLGTLGGSFSQPRDISPDGRFVGGYSKTAGDTATHSFRWTSSGGMLDIGTLPGETDSYARAVSADGTVVVGESSGLRAFRWTVSGGMSEIGPGVASTLMPEVFLEMAVSLLANRQGMLSIGQHQPG